jgi:hypothetical protein
MPKLVHALHHEAIGCQHYRHPRGFQRNHQIAEIQGFTNTNKLDGRLYHAFWGVAVGEQHTLGQGPMVDPNAHGLYSDPAKKSLAAPGFREFWYPISSNSAWVYSVRLVLGFFKYIKARINADLIDMLGHFQGNFHAVMMNIGDQRHWTIGRRPILL